MKRIIILLIVTFVIAGCKTTDAITSAIPSFGDSQEITNTENNNATNGAIGKIETEVNNTDGKAQSYDGGSSHQSEDTDMTQAVETSSGNGAKVAAVLNDESVNHNDNDTEIKTATDDDNIKGDQNNHQIKNGMSDEYIFGMFIIFIIYSAFIWWLSGWIALRRRDKYRDRYEKV